ncbi:LysR family transcriptional regulator [Notoacmeibacter sp. MSK16QG-6]|uniref:LysR family transcriptional regulator n=1 Tax=Notoacmeibacter sp. MSK16QG-6 TaxID=2957982 RepID=UPI00209DF62D|nr:LysR family transcriptional regulator [Notoacmeibacter sp. MSK16QG-6]MCP1199028.1 LysR family transcriptional regulator [Notoacmeibacter sp. MSK16QG-6]
MQDRLEMLIALVREKHFGRAAETLGITQPSLSFGIRALEDQLGAPLVRRGSRYQGLTAEGERVYERALRIVAETRALKDDVRGANGELSGLLRFGVVPTALPLAAELVAATRKEHPALRFRILSQTASEIEEGLARLELEAGLSYTKGLEARSLHVHPIHTEHSCLLVHESHELASRKNVDWADVGSAAPCLLTPGMTNRAIVEERLREAGVTPSPSVDSNSIIALVTLVALGGHALVLPEQLAHAVAGQGPVKRVAIKRGRGAPDDPQIALLLPNRHKLPASLVALRKAARKRVEV